MAAQRHAPPRREGVAYVEHAPSLPPEADVTAQWVRPDGTQEGEYFGEVAEAIGWARSRAPVVLVRVDRALHAVRYHRVAGLWLRLHSPVTFTYGWYSAGEEPTTENDAARWPHPLRAGAARAEGYGGEVQVTVGDPSWNGMSGQLRGSWESFRDDEVVVLEQVLGVVGEDGERLIAWARSRARFVLLCFGPANYQYFSAGDDIPGLELPSWDPRPEEIPPGPPGSTWTVSRQGRTFPPGWEDDAPG
jgi:hypothetical protein